MHHARYSCPARPSPPYLRCYRARSRDRTRAAMATEDGGHQNKHSRLGRCGVVRHIGRRRPGGRPGGDHSRVAAQIVSGIGFLGAGVILRDGLNIRGLTTAATLWCAAAVGSLAGAGMSVVALIGAIAIIGTNTLLRPLSKFVNRRFARVDMEMEEGDARHGDYMFEATSSESNEQRVRALVLQMVDRPEYTLRSVEVRPSKSSQVKIVASLSSNTAGDSSGLESAVRRISLDPNVTSSRWWPVESDD
jgi:putative Mg2+ transporter-C (MgtC) family protein